MLFKAKELDGVLSKDDRERKDISRLKARDWAQKGGARKKDDQRVKGTWVPKSKRRGEGML